MPKWKCSDLQRVFMKTEVVKLNKRTPAYSFFKSHHRLGGRIKDKRPTRMSDKEAMIPDSMGPFFTPGGRYNGQPVLVFRWLYFQTHDDRDLFDAELHSHTIAEYSRSRFAKDPEKITNLEEMRDATWFNCVYQEEMVLRIRWWNPHTEAIRQPDEFSLDPKFSSTGHAIREMAKRTRATRPAGSFSAMVKNPAWRGPLLFPWVVGKDRIKLVGHYLCGGTDEDRPFQKASELTCFVSQDWVKRHGKSPLEVREPLIYALKNKLILP